MLQQKYDEKCDIWSAGVILYIMLCGYPPFNAKHDDEIYNRIQKGEFTYREKDWASISPEVIAWFSYERLGIWSTSVWLTTPKIEFPLRKPWNTPGWSNLPNRKTWTTRCNCNPCSTTYRLTKLKIRFKKPSILLWSNIFRPRSKRIVCCKCSEPWIRIKTVFCLKKNW